MRACSRWRRFLLLLPVIIYIFHTLSVLEVRKNSTSDIPHKKKSDHLVLGPAAGEGLPNRLHCQGNKALNKIDSFASSAHSSIGVNISFVTVFTAYRSTDTG